MIDISGIATCENEEMTREIRLGKESLPESCRDFPIVEAKPVVLHIANREGKKLTVDGEVDMTAAIPCDRCLEDVPTRIRFSVEREFSLKDGGICSGEADDGVLEGFGLDEERLLGGEILLNWPMKVLCREDCKGICKVCGQNLNHGECGCERSELDPRMAAALDVFNKFKEV